MAKATIVIEEMRDLVQGLEDGISELTSARTTLITKLLTYEIDHDLGQGVQQAIDWGETELPGVRRRLALAEALEQTSPGPLPGSTELDDDTAISTVSPEEAEQAGEDAAQELLDSHGDISEDLAEQIEENMNDPYFAAGFANNASPEQIASVLEILDAQVEATTVSQELRDSLVTSLGTTLGTATRNVGDLAMPEDYADQWADAITAESQNQGGDARDGQAQYLAMLMQQGVYSRPFLNTIGDEIYAYEAEGENGAVWGPKNGPMTILDPNGDPVIDVMAAYMGALENNPLAAQDFFSQGGTETVEINGQEVEINSRLQYLTQERTWSHQADMSNGGNFGGALEAATTVYRNDETTGATSAEIASQTFALIGDETATNDGWKMWNGMRGNVANMLASYGPDLLRISRTGQVDSEFGDPWTVSPETELYGDGAPHGAALDPEMVQQILGTFGEDEQDDHLETVLTGVGAASQWRMSVALEEALGDNTEPSAPVAILTGGNVPQLTTATNEMAAAFGFVINGAYHGALDEEALEAKQAQMRSQIFGAMTSLPGIGPAGQWSKFAFDQIKGHIGRELASSDASASGEFGALSAEEREQLQQMILNQMLAGGYFDQEYIDDANNGGDRYASPMDPEYEGAVIPGSDPPQFDFESDAYQDWLRTKYPMDDFLNSNVYVPFEQHLEAGLELAKG